MRGKLVVALIGALALLGLGGGVTAASTPTSVTLAGTVESALGCGNWDQACAGAHMAAGADGVYRLSVGLAAGDYEYKVAIADSWAENYGAHAQRDGGNIQLHLASARTVHFLYDPVSHWVTDDVNSKIVSAPGTIQSALGCSGDWDPSCLKTWLEDVDGDGTYTFTTTALPRGSYEFKLAVGQSWDENYGAGGVQNGPNIPVTVRTPGSTVTISFTYATKSVSVSVVAPGPSHDDNVEWDGLGFDSRSTLYKVPQGAVPAGTPVTVRFRTFHDDVTSVKVRVWDANANKQRLVKMVLAAHDVSCYQSSLASSTCDYWQATLPTPQPDVLWYRFVVQDGTATAYYADDTTALDGGTGTTTAGVVDNSYAQTVYDPSFKVPAWASHAVVYQIFPDRFANGDRKNDPKPTDALYDTHPTLKDWNDRPEGYCRSYDPPCAQGPHGTDYFGGDLKGIRQKLEWIHGNGFNTIYLNPIFWAKSNHRYDTADYLQIDPYLGDMKEFKLLVQQAHELGMHIILDGVFNHMSSDSPFFDRYHHSATLGACESLASQYRSWFTFTDSNVPCGAGDYTGWAGFDSIPVLNKSNPDVQQYFLTGDDSVTKHWLRAGADGWRLDVMGDPSFPAGYWQTFRQVVKQTDPDALIVGELWQKDTTLLRLLAGDAADSTMNYRLRDAVLGLLGPQAYDGKGFGDSGHPLTPTQFAARMSAQREDYAPPVYSALMNLIDSHDTARALWDLTPGAKTTAAKEQDAANLAQGKQRLRIASLIQYTIPGMPTVYYGDEVGVTGGDDPDNRRTYPWPNTGGTQDAQLLAHYRALAALRATQPELVDGDFKVLLADDATGTVAYGRKDGSRAAIVAVNRSASPQTLTVDVGGWLPDGTQLQPAFGDSAAAAVSGGAVSVAVPPLSGVVLATGAIDLTPPAAPTGLSASAGDGSVSLTWSGVDGAASYVVYRSPVAGGYVRVGATTGTGLTDASVANGQRYHYVVRALDAAGNESGDSNDATAVPHFTIGWANVQWPPAIDHPLTAAGDTVYGQVWVHGLTDAGGSPDSIEAQLGFGRDGSDPSAWTWSDASFNVQAGNNFEYKATLRPDTAGDYDYLYRYSTDLGTSWTYAGTGGPGTTSPGRATIGVPADTTAPATPTELRVASGSPTEIDLAWNANAESDLYGYEVLRSDAQSGPYAILATAATPSYTDTTVDEGATYFYEVRAVDQAFNRSAATAPVSATAALRTVHVEFDVTVPSWTPADKVVHIAGTLSQLDGGLPDWDPAAVSLTRVDGTHWQIALTGREGTQLQYKYTLGSWDFVEKGAVCDEIANRTLTLAYGSSGTQIESDTVLNWRNLNGCPN
jgi:glycosidase